MRSFLAGLITLCMSIAAFAQTKGEVESIGFNTIYRPDCLTPMVVRISPGPLKTDFYQIQVKQRDLDGDETTFSRTISLTGGTEGGGKDQRFWMYFNPTPSGLPDASYGVRDLQKELNVFLCTKAGKQICALPLTTTMLNVDPIMSSFTGVRRGTKLILCVVGPGAQPSFDEFESERVIGQLESVAFVKVNVDSLPDSPLGYDAVDGVLWTNVDPADLKRSGDAKFRALETYVRQGGNLTILQNSEWQKTLEFGDLLPVVPSGMQQKLDAFPLRTLAQSTGQPIVINVEGRTSTIPDPWLSVKGPIATVRAEPKANAIVDEWLDWDDKGADRSPYIVRAAFGLGGVTWVAQDLSDPAITGRAKIGWLHVWDRVFDWKNTPLIVTPAVADVVKAPYANANAVDLGPSLLQAMEFKGTVSLLVTVAIAFFIVYWLIAGPGFYTYLAHRRRTNLSWFMFGLSAVVATGVTMLIVKLVLRGPPELKHESTISAAAGDPAIVTSRIGLYIKRDGDQTISLKSGASAAPATLFPYPLHPASFVSHDQKTIAPMEYSVPIHDTGSDDPTEVTVPYRSSLKKFLARWTGEIAIKDSTGRDSSGRIDGVAKLVAPPKFIDGKLTNNTGKRLQNVYIAFKYPGPGVTAGDWMLYLPAWDIGVTIDLASEFYMDSKGNRTSFVNIDTGKIPEKDLKLIGKIATDWQERYWEADLKRAVGLGDGKIEDDSAAVPKSFPIMSFFDRLKPVMNQPGQNPDRVEILRRGGRKLDRSSALSGGALVIIAQAKGSIPVPLEVEGDKIDSTGTVFYQFVLPLDRKEADSASTQPSQN